MSEVLDLSRNAETGELTQFTILDDTGQPQLVKATPSNILLYDPTDELPFDDGLHGFLSGDQALVLSDEDPEIIVAPTNNKYCYILRVRGNTVETTPKQAESVLEGIKQAAIDGEIAGLQSLYNEIMSNQVRRPVVAALHQTFDEKGRIDITNRGWLIDEFYLVNWEANMYLRHNDPDEPDKMRSGSGITETDRSYEFVQLRIGREIEPIEVAIQGDKYRLTEREMLFLAKVKWLLNRREYHPDKPFWYFSDKQGASVDWKTGEPKKDNADEPDLDKFNI
jgi:hypothetical protein